MDHGARPTVLQGILGTYVGIKVAMEIFLAFNASFQHIWLNERIMTVRYDDEMPPAQSSVVRMRKSIVSLSNVIASTCQYEALKHVSFVVQLRDGTRMLGKSFKTIPVMMWGMVVSGKRYSLTDWLLAAVVTAGITIFLISGPHRAPGEAGSLGAESEAKRVAPMRLSRSALSAFFPFILSFVEGTGCSTLAGLALLSGFLALDGLTSVMEEKLFKERTEREEPQPDPEQYAEFVKWFEAFNKATAKEGGKDMGGAGRILVKMLQFVQTPDLAKLRSKAQAFLRDASFLSLSAVAAQYFIYSQIREFGAVVFALTMNIRQEMLEAAHYPDKAVADDMASGFNLVGHLELPAGWAPDFRPASISASDLAALSRDGNQQIIRDVASSSSFTEELWQKSMEEAGEQRGQLTNRMPTQAAPAAEVPPPPPVEERPDMGWIPPPPPPYPEPRVLFTPDQSERFRQHAREAPLLYPNADSTSSSEVQAEVNRRLLQYVRQYEGEAEDLRGQVQQLIQEKEYLLAARGQQNPQGDRAYSGPQNPLGDRA
ncbi:UDP-galactose/UDP-glucose transporter 5B [Symbiodinium microadriaticum]|uniref:UDP-galactose/UDP-glucose transporter 5B n=1 Tax=Symbiodinium microadriaticum TaxID=2951 RepID=A0A1Q9C7A3_SYMMI|nr:UDP-galactose/UDP-glucose transporter 5B [Symbiodinium microadriaticum]